MNLRNIMFLAKSAGSVVQTDATKLCVQNLEDKLPTFD